MRKQRQWHAFIKREKIESAEVGSFAHVVQRLNDFLFPVVDTTRMDTEFDHFWNPAKGWSKV